MGTALNVLLITASAQQKGSVTRRFASEMIDELESQHGVINLKERDVSQGLPFVDEDWVAANFTPADTRSKKQQDKLSLSDELVEEIKQADVLVMAAPIYNFSVPASLKAWIDMVCRVGLTFNYTSEGPVGLLKGKKAYIVIASGGTRIGSEIDYASDYLRHVMGFMGIDDVELISAERFNHEDQGAINKIQSRIAQLVQQAA